jgi:hypothetical protein
MPPPAEEPKATRPDRDTHAVLGVQSERRIVARPDRVGKKLMSARVTPPTWRFFKKGSAELDVTQEAMLRTALALFMSRFRGVPEAGYQAVWEAIRKEAAGED